ncbi:MAG: MerR family transcriptional regulator [Lachnospiraceae bacterium]|nr:MerR family transcriptional regulator [Lachnospiraceae bacterium]MBQ6967972.1 MerR family transcriptional regulator [Lachnospiraceae bacterium]
MKYTITDLSKKFDLPASTIRYYEKIGLLENVEHINSRRSYDDSHVDRLNAIECFKKALLPLDEIRLFFTYEKDMASNADKILDMMKDQEAKTLDAIDALQAGLTHLKKKIRFYSLVSESVKNNSPLPKWEDVNP